MTDEPTCRDCKYFDEESSHAEYGSCKYYPPSIITHDARRRPPVHTSPHVDENDWCGQFEEKKQPPKAMRKVGEPESPELGKEPTSPDFDAVDLNKVFRDVTVVNAELGYRIWIGLLDKNWDAIDLNKIFKNVNLGESELIWLGSLKVGVKDDE